MVLEKIYELERSRTPRAFKAEESFWDSEIDRMVKLLKRHCRLLDEDLLKERSHSERPILSIAAFGSYGTGKSSLLKTFVHRINDSKIRKQWDLEKKVFSLPVMEAHLFAPDESFLYSFLATALEEDSKKRRDQDEDESAQLLSHVQQAFQSVSEYLQVLDEARHPQEYDPLGFSLDRLERHTSGLRLREKIGGLIEGLAKEAGATAIILPVDEIDSTGRLLSTLETCRLYLCHPQLVPVFTFTSQVAEELIRVQFVRQLVGPGEPESLDGTGTKSHLAALSEQLAFQYLNKLFPSRNRIRMGPAPARVLLASYKTASEVEDRVLQTLTAASRLLFGWERSSDRPSVRYALRPSHLRRQLQIVEAMVDAGVPDIGDLLKKPSSIRGGDEDPVDQIIGQLKQELQRISDEPGPCDPDKIKADLGSKIARWKRRKEQPLHWFQVFDSAARSLLIIQWDVLRKLDISPDQLYGWNARTPQSRRRAVLGTILALCPKTRRNLLKRWRYRSNDRRSQIVSLLGLITFRPEMLGEEPRGDNTGSIEAQAASALDAPSQPGFSAMKWMIWNLNLWVGFYLPQIMAAKYPARRGDASRRIIGGEWTDLHAAGWNLRSGPAKAIWKFRRTGLDSTTGMVSLEQTNFRSLGRSGRTKPNMARHIWCFYGLDRNGGGGSAEFWAALSFWRGAALIGRVMRLHERLLLQQLYEENSWNWQKERLSKEKRGKLEDQVGELLEQHCEAAWVSDPSEGGNVDFKRWPVATKEERKKNDPVRKLAAELCRWLDADAARKAVVAPLYDPPEKNTDPWEECHIRRLHGDYFIGSFWPLLEAVGTGVADGVLDEWKTLLSRHLGPRIPASGPGFWGGSPPDWAKILDACPLFDLKLRA